MTPTQAQIEALNECADDLESMINGSYANSLDYPRQKRKYERDLMTVSRAREAIAALTAVAEVGDDPELDDITIRFQLERIKTLEAELAATIERCAQVAENTPCLGYGKEPGEVVAAAIRALKNES